MPRYENHEFLEMVIIYGESGRNARLAARTYAERFPDRQRPDHRVINNVVTRLSETGTFAARPRAGRPAIHAPRTQDVIEYVTANPQASTRGIGQALGMDHTAVWRLLREHHYHPYRVHLHQALHGNDFQNRLDFCNWMELQIERDPEFLNNVMTTDESTFYRDGTVNRHNCHYWSPVNPHWLQMNAHQENWRVNVWCGIHGNTLVGPVFLGNLNGETYVELLQTVVTEYVENMPLAVLRRFWYQQDGAPAHYRQTVRDRLNEMFPERWIGRAGPVPWPARSPDLTPVDFFLWGYVKSLVYVTGSESPEDLKNKIREACASITPDVLTNVRRTWIKRLRDCIIADGHHFEHFY